MTTRRMFLRSTSLLCAAVAISPKLAGQTSPGQSSLFSDQNLFLYTHDLMTEAALRRQIGSSFTVMLPGGGASSIRLMNVVGAQEDVGTAASMTAGAQSLPPIRSAGRVGLQAAAVKGFRLSFAVEGRTFPQGSYTLAHGVTGTVVMFLVPGDTAGAMKSCSAVFTTM